MEEEEEAAAGTQGSVSLMKRDDKSNMRSDRHVCALLDVFHAYHLAFCACPSDL